MLKLEEYIKSAVDLGASDLHFKPDSAPLLRVNGELRPMLGHRLSAEECRDVSTGFLTPQQLARFEADLEIDLAGEVPGLTRFRANILHQRGEVSAIIRMVSTRVPTADELGLLEIMKDMALRPRGLILVTGPAGSGKSTTQAALLDHVNSNEYKHIMTVEDPVEFIHDDKLSIVNQREVGTDTHSFASALKYVLRQDPDVILIGEMRNIETIAMAVTAAETGHLVIGTLHTPEAVRAVDRIIDVFPSFQQSQIRLQLANNLVGVISQRMVRRTARPGGRIPVFEILVANNAVRGMIREAKSHQIRSTIQTGVPQGMQTFDMHLARLVRDGTVTSADALEASLHPEDLRRLLGLPLDDDDKARDRGHR